MFLLWIHKLKARNWFVGFCFAVILLSVLCRFGCGCACYFVLTITVYMGMVLFMVCDLYTQSFNRSFQYLNEWKPYNMNHEFITKHDSWKSKVLGRLLLNNSQYWADVTKACHTWFESTGDALAAGDYPWQALSQFIASIFPKLLLLQQFGQSHW